jgi:hypothetical protein
VPSSVLEKRRAGATPPISSASVARRWASGCPIRSTPFKWSRSKALALINKTIFWLQAGIPFVIFWRMTHTRILAFAAVLLILAAGCGAEKSTKNIERGLTELAKLDPLALKKLLDENEDLRKKLTDINARLQGLPTGSGKVGLKNYIVRTEVTHYTGKFEVNGWINSRTNWFWLDQPFNELSVRLPLDYERIYGDARAEIKNKLNKIWRKLPSYSAAPAEVVNESVGKSGAVFISAYQSAVENAFQKFLTNAVFTPLPLQQDAELNTKFIEMGKHVVSIEITPLAPNASGIWALQGRVALYTPDGKELVGKTHHFNVSSDKYGVSYTNKALPIINALVHVTGE